MNKKIYFLTLTILFAAGLLLAGCSNDPGEADNNAADYNYEEDAGQEDIIEQYSSTDSQEGVTAQALWIAPELYELAVEEELVTENELEENIIFDLWLSTHSGDLMDFSYEDNVVLSTDNGEISPRNITVISRDSHHPRMLLKFEKSRIEDTENMELLIKGLRNVPKRTFSW
ncbi:hypothetical protein [Dethiobacter alkaliphilus]|uniref:Lipoprotein n=1 Tax=Dethiobacter alkaliphilus AHT 1 TaxID=555088 RepID=C0GFL5_DETAL|nr:hypothetical protein [Dethiobacter alkaliphilus]EEG77975.1 conserved hypothetical protein [Dethiobacter alkaliphilus AHT 1]